jgi:hypothetical protein
MVAGAAALLGIYLAAAYNRSLPPSSDFGGLKEAIQRVFFAAIGGASAGGLIVLVFYLPSHDNILRYPSWALVAGFIAYVATMAAVGVAVSCAAL